MPPVETEDFV